MGRRAPKEVKRQAHRMAGQGFTHKQIAFCLGYTLRSVDRWLTEFADPVPLQPWEVPAWTAGALCAQIDPELFFPENGRGGETAKKICKCCPVQNDCLQYALTHREEWGVWGGLSTSERRRRWETIP